MKKTSYLSIVLFSLFCIYVYTFHSSFGQEESYIPPTPNPPSSYDQSLAFVFQDKTNELAVHGISADRRLIFEMFPIEARQYLLNVNQNWYWGDGTSSQGAAPSHTYSNANKYEIQMITDVSFRGGATVIIKCKNTINIDPPVASDSINIDMPAIPATGTGIQTINILVNNSGGKGVSLRPTVTAAETGWVSITPFEKIIMPNSECFSTFSLILDWTKNPDDPYVNIEWEKTTIVGAWCLKYFQ